MRTVAVWCALGGLLTSAAIGENVTLYPVETADVACDVEAASAPRILLRFDVSRLPKDARIQYAGLALNDGCELPWETPFVPALVGALTRDWDASASWDGPSTGEDWQNPGGDWDRGLTAYRVLVKKAPAPGRFLVTEMVRRWVTGELPNFGVIVMVEEGADLADVSPHFSVETLKPSLEVRYFMPQDYR